MIMLDKLFNLNKNIYFEKHYNAGILFGWPINTFLYIVPTLPSFPAVGTVACSVRVLPSLAQGLGRCMALGATATVAI